VNSIFNAQRFEGVHARTAVIVGRSDGEGATLRRHRTVMAGKALAAQLLILLAVGVPPTGKAADGDLSAAEPAVAQGSAASDDPAAPVAQLQTISVTAQKRTEDIKDIPTSVSAIDADQLADHHVANYDDITRAVPGISFQAGAGPGLDNIEIRGVSSSSGSSTVGIYVDEVAITTKNTFDGAVQPKLFDLERIEVLRGPQGTLYGASSMGGTIRFISRQPDLYALGGSAGTDLSFTRHGGFNNDENAVLNVPVDKGVFALRFGLDVSHESGYIDHLAPTPDGYGPGGSLLTLNTNDTTGQLARSGVNDQRTTVFRASGKYVGDGDLTIAPALLLQKVESGDSGVFYPSIGLYEQDKRVAEPGKDILVVPSLNINKGLEWADVTSVTSYFRRNFRRTTDGTYYNSNIFASILDSINSGSPPAVPPLYPPAQLALLNYQSSAVLGFLPSPVYFNTTTDQFAQELRLASKLPTVAGIPVTWVGGVYFSNQRVAHTDDEYMVGLNNAYQQIYGTSISQSPAVGTAAFPGVSYANDYIYYAYSHSDERQIAPFGQLGVELTPRLKGSIGLRFVSARVSYGFVGGGFYGFGLPSPYAADTNYSATTPKFSLEYALSEATNLYANAAKGFRLGGPTGPDPANVPGGPCDQDYANLGIPGAPLSYDSDSLWSYEAGTKGRYFNGRLSVNAAVYAIDWKNIQQSVNLPICGFTFTTNAGDAKSYGTELELRALVTSGLTLSLNAGSTHAYITRTSEPGIFSVGESILNVPDFSATLSADYDVMLNDTTTGFVRADFPWTGKSHAYYNSSTVINHWSPAYGILNLNVGATRKGMQVALYAKNLLNSRKIIQYPSVDSVQEGYTVRPLTVGVTASLQL
jgi:iron complex outermembrane receptor protein